MPRRVETALSILRDPNRAFVLFTKFLPATPPACERPSYYNFVSDLRDFHRGARVTGGRFQIDYDVLCHRLKLAIADLECCIHAYGFFEIPDSSPPVWQLHIMKPDWSAPADFNQAYTTQHIWHDLYHLKLDLEHMPHPHIQRTYLDALPTELLSMITEYLPMTDTRRLMATNWRFAGICSRLAARHAKVSFWYNHAYLGLNRLRRSCDKIGAPATSLGYALAAFWCWLSEREASGRLTTTETLTLVNRWAWSRTVYAEAHWNERLPELRAWAVVFYCGVFGLSCLRTVRIDGFAMPYDGVETLSMHPTLTGLHLHACGFMLRDEARPMPLLLNILRLTIGWDPLSPFEVAGARRFLSLAPNIETLQLYHRLPGAAPLGLGAGWTGGPMIGLQSLTVKGADPSFVSALLAQFQSRVLRTFKLYLDTTPRNADILNVLATLAAQNDRLERLVLHGCARPQPAFLAAITAHFPHILDLAILPRLRNQTRMGTHDWVMTCSDIADSLRRLGALRRFCANFTVYPDAIGSLHLDTLCGTTPPNPDPEAHERSNDDLCQFRAAARPFLALFPAIHEFAVLDGLSISIGEITRHAATPAQMTVLEPRPYRDGGEWWQEACEAEFS